MLSGTLWSPNCQDRGSDLLGYKNESFKGLTTGLIQMILSSPSLDVVQRLNAKRTC